jgi:hypothetical protein
MSDGKSHNIQLSLMAPMASGGPNAVSVSNGG